MPTATSSLFLEGLLFSSANVALVVFAIWWVYLSPTRAQVGPPVPPSPRLAAGLAFILGFSALQLTIGGYWDGSMHILTGEIPGGADFLWPPHLMIYSAFLISLVVALVSLALIGLPAWRAGDRDPRVWVRRHPYLGAVLIASMYSLFSVPGDALWHLLYGIDLTAWSPPHVLIAASMVTVVISAVGVLAQVRTPQSGPVDIAIPILLGLALCVSFLIGTVEWELWGGQFSALVLSNPIWVYPMVAGALAFTGLLLAKRLSRWRWAATLTMLTFFGVRGGTNAAMAITDNVVAFWPPLFIAGAVLLDLIPWGRIASPLWQQVGMAAGFTLSYAVLAWPALATRANLPTFAGADLIIALIATLIVTVILTPLILKVSQAMLGPSAGRTSL